MESSLAPFAQNLEEAELTHADIALQWNPDHHGVSTKPGKSQSQVSVQGWGQVSRLYPMLFFFLTKEIETVCNSFSCLLLRGLELLEEKLHCQRAKVLL